MFVLRVALSSVQALVPGTLQVRSNMMITIRSVMITMTCRESRLAHQPCSRWRQIVQKMSAIGTDQKLIMVLSKDAAGVMRGVG